MHFLCRIAASLGRCISAPPSVFCRYLLILSLNLMASVLLAAPGRSCLLMGQSGFLRDSFASFAVPLEESCFLCG
ncbi:hypothetical protein V8C86DRAFT_2997953, partial [Haematococcus lacustris]